MSTEDPGLVMQEGLKYGSLVGSTKQPTMKRWKKNVKFEPVVERICYHRSAAGDGLATLISGQGSDYIISADKPNPSTEDFVSGWRVECTQHYYSAKQQKYLDGANLRRRLINLQQCCWDQDWSQGLTSLLCLDESKSRSKKPHPWVLHWAMLCPVVWRQPFAIPLLMGLKSMKMIIWMVDGKIVASNPDMMEASKKHLLIC